MPSHPEDLALAARIAGGDHSAADEFARQFVPRFRHLALRAGVAPQDCEDVAQEVFLRAFSQLQRGIFRGDSSLGTWLDRILHGVIVDHWRHRPREITESDISPDEGALNEQEGILTNHADRQIDQHAVMSVHETLMAMPFTQRVILLLKRSFGYTLAELARALHLTIGQVGTRLYAAEETFRLLLNGTATQSRTSDRTLCD